MVFRTASFLLALLAIVGGVNSAAIGEERNYGESEWPAGISPLDSLSYWRKENSEKAPDADNKRPCCLPRVWTGRLFVEYREEGPGGKITIRYLLAAYYDQVNKRLASDMIAGNKTVSSQIILFNKTGATWYSFWKKTKRCATQFLPGAKIRPQCIPSNATLFRSFSLGAGIGALKTESWGYYYHDSRVDSSTNILLTPGNCVPVISATASTSRDAQRRVTSQLSIGTLYTDMKTYIPDTSVFSPPSYCKKRGEEEEAEEAEAEAEVGEEEDEKLYFDHRDFHTNTIIESFVAVP